MAEETAITAENLSAAIAQAHHDKSMAARLRQWCHDNPQAARHALETSPRMWQWAKTQYSMAWLGEMPEAPTKG